MNNEWRIHVLGSGSDLFKYSEAVRRPLWLINMGEKLRKIKRET